MLIVKSKSNDLVNKKKQSIFKLQIIDLKIRELNIIIRDIKNTINKQYFDGIKNEAFYKRALKNSIEQLERAAEERRFTQKKITRLKYTIKNKVVDINNAKLLKKLNSKN